MVSSYPSKYCMHSKRNRLKLYVKCAIVHCKMHAMLWYLSRFACFIRKREPQSTSMPMKPLIRSKSSTRSGERLKRLCAREHSLWEDWYCSSFGPPMLSYFTGYLWIRPIWVATSMLTLFWCAWVRMHVAFNCAFFTNSINCCSRNTWLHTVLGGHE